MFLKIWTILLMHLIFWLYNDSCPNSWAMYILNYDTDHLEKWNMYLVTRKVSVKGKPGKKDNQEHWGYDTQETLQLLKAKKQRTIKQNHSAVCGLQFETSKWLLCSEVIQAPSMCYCHLPILLPTLRPLDHSLIAKNHISFHKNSNLSWFPSLESKV